MVDVTRRDFGKSSVALALTPLLNLEEKKSKEEKIYYKVVDSHHRSARWWPRNLGSIEYKINEWVTPTIGKIFVFNTKES